MCLLYCVFSPSLLNCPHAWKSFCALCKLADLSTLASSSLSPEVRRSKDGPQRPEVGRDRPGAEPSQAPSGPTRLPALLGNPGQVWLSPGLHLQPLCCNLWSPFCWESDVLWLSLLVVSADTWSNTSPTSGSESPPQRRPQPSHSSVTLSMGDESLHGGRDNPAQRTAATLLLWMSATRSKPFLFFFLFFFMFSCREPKHFFCTKSQLAVETT